mmetsp:Transcript_34203/g.46267  ORF Transcript_34203/g.46267 Transcript_34203/m.46267 type:complete len:347 (-) Transcript_34203:263-1303(-)|eukprot:CAMPEP_0185774588 /NCGR_PEP_ID=MMETSP1174-20130828/78925_1 /TAXON_ID=35687 /ORGANISM="Dictyocha speculum, Strain CCMP1381" /LENGTH=346 /DNA_ID=CAMNT_0028461825 /DNA_START=4 /DNA_END=1044 /DNA_ORIENTATION=-
MSTCLAFNVEWDDEQSATVKHFRLNYFSEDNSIEMMQTLPDGKRRCFMGRIFCPSVQEKDLRIGSSIFLHGRQLHISAYADEGTRLACAERIVFCLALVKPGAVETSLGSVLRLSTTLPFRLSHAKLIELDDVTASLFQCAPGVAVAVEACASIGGPRGGASYSELEQEWASNRGAMVHCCACLGERHELAHACFDLPAPRSGPDDAVTACVVRPHIVDSEGSLGDVIGAILDAGFVIDRLEVLHLTRKATSEFFGVYRGVLASYEKMIAHMSSGNSVYVRLRGDPDIVRTFREFCGPINVEVARMLRPKTLRARFGSNEVLNAVHCTDLEEDGVLECSFFDRLMQ